MIAAGGFGPLLVAMDSHGGSLYAAVNRADIEIRRGEWPVMQASIFGRMRPRV